MTRVRKPTRAERVNKVGVDAEKARERLNVVRVPGVGEFLTDAPYVRKLGSRHGGTPGFASAATVALFILLATRSVESARAG
jgi:hypothetical protein